MFFQGSFEADRKLRALAEKEQYDCLETNIFQFKDSCGWHQVPQGLQQTSHNRECFKPPCRYSWAKRATERDFEAHVAATPLTEPEVAEKARFDEMVRGQGALPLSNVSYAMVASAIKNEGMLCLAPAGCGKSVLLRQLKAVL